MLLIVLIKCLIIEGKMTIKIGQYTGYPNYAAMAAKLEQFDKHTFSCLTQEAQDQVTKKMRVIRSMKIEDFDPQKLECWLKCWERILVEGSIAVGYQNSAKNLQNKGFKLDDVKPQSQEAMGHYFLEGAQMSAAEKIAKFRTGCMLAEAHLIPDILRRPQALTLADIKPEAYKKVMTREGDADKRSNCQRAELRSRLYHKKTLEEYTDEIRNLHDQIRWLAHLSSQGKEFDTFSQQQIADQWQAFNQKKSHLEDSGVDPEFMKELEAEAREQKGTPAKAQNKKNRPKHRLKAKAVQPAPEQEKGQTVSSEVTQKSGVVPEFRPLNLKTKVQGSKRLFSLHRRVKRWRDAKLSEISTFFDFDSQRGAWVQHYAGYTLDELNYQKRVHAIPMECIMNQPALVDKYSFKYKFCGSDGTKNQTGRCFYAEMADRNGKVEMGLIRVASSDRNEIYHIHFHKADTMSIAQLTQPVPCLQKEVSEGKEAPTQAEEGEYQHVGAYSLTSGPGDTLVMTIHEDGTSFKIWPV